MRQIYIIKIMMKSKRIDFLFKKNACDEDEKNASILIKIEKFHDNLRIKKNEKQFSKVFRVIYNEFKKI